MMHCYLCFVNFFVFCFSLYVKHVRTKMIHTGSNTVVQSKGKIPLRYPARELASELVCD